MKLITTEDLVYDKNEAAFLGLAKVLEAKELISVDEEDFFTVEVLNPAIAVLDTKNSYIYHFEFISVASSSAGVRYEYVANSKAKGELRLALYK